MKVSVLLMSAATASALLGAARPLTVGAPDGSGNVTVTIGGTGTGDQALIAAWANADKGDDPLEWTEYADAGTVAAELIRNGTRQIILGHLSKENNIPALAYETARETLASAGAVPETIFMMSISPSNIPPASRTGITVE